MNDDNKESSWRVVVFSGKREDSRKWSKKFMAYAIHKGFYDLIEGNETTPQVADQTNMTDEETKKIETVISLVECF